MREKIRKIRKEVKELECLLNEIGSLAIYLDRETEEMLFLSLSSIYNQLEKIKHLIKETERELDKPQNL